MSKVCWIDTETTGLMAHKNDIVNLAIIIEVDKKVVVEKEFFMQPFSYENIETKALAINGLTLEKIKAFPKPQEVFKELKELLRRYVSPYDRQDKFSPAGHNVHFDTDFLKQFWKKNGDTFYGSFFNYRTIDTLQLLYLMDGRGHISLKSYKLVDVCKYFNITHEGQHTALGDIRATRELAEFLGTCLILDKELMEKGYAEFCKRRGELTK